jgi:hypothetical protein
MVAWATLSEAERSDIEDKVIAALESLGVKGATTWWNKPAQLSYWQLIIQSSWCEMHSRTDAFKVTDQAIAAAKIEAPRNDIILKSHRKVWRP